MKQMIRILTAALLLGVFAGCGYKPASGYARAVVGEKVSTQVVISSEDPENTVLIKDAIQAAVITRFRASIVPRSESDTHLRILLKSVKFTPIQYDENGYIVVYRTRVALQITRESGKEAKNYTVSGVYDFTIEPKAIISDQARFDAIRNGAEKALDVFVARIAAEGVVKTSDK